MLFWAKFFFASPIARAHGLYDPLPPGIFQLKWSWDPTLLFFVAMGFAYWHGLRSFKRPPPIALWQKLCFCLGLLVLISGLLPPIDPLSDRLFFMHMIQHLMITSIGVPLLLFGAPFFVIMRGAPPWVRRKIYFPLLRNRGVRFFNYLMTTPLIALAVYEGMTWFWHVPFFYNLALLNDAFHLLEHAGFAFAALYAWRNIIDPYPLKSRLAMPVRLLFIAAMEALNIVLSAFLTFSDSVWYAYQGIPAPQWWTWGHLEDQHLGGLIMWVPGGMIHVLALTIVFFVWVGREQAKDRALLVDKLATS